MRRLFLTLVATSALTVSACSGGTSGDTATETAGVADEAAASSVAPAPAPGSEEDAGEAADAGSGGDTAAGTTEGPLELPRGGTELFPRYRLIGYAGYPGSPGMGRLGIGDLDERVEEIEPELGDFVGDREPMPTLELIASIAHPVPGADGSYRTHAPDEVIDDYLAAANRHDAILLLNIQTGAVPFLEEVQNFEEWLVEPNVGVALDPEWAVEPGQVPGEVYGRTSGEELNEVAAYLADLVEEHGLPEKAMVYHQVHEGVVQDEGDFVAHDGVVAIKSVDGIGHPNDKVATFDRVNESTPDHVRGGFKLFLEEDAVFGPIMTAEEVAELDPEIEYLMVE